MSIFERVKKFYPKLYSKKQVADFVRKGVLTEEEYEEIVGEPINMEG